MKNNHPAIWPAAFRFPLAAFLLALLLPSCGQKAPPPLPEVDYQKAKELSDATAQDLVGQNVKDLSNRLDVGFHSVVSGPADLRKVLLNMDSLYGRPVTWVFKVAKQGVRTDGQWKRNSRTFFYAVKTTKYPMGKYFLKVEVVNAISGGFLDVSGFGFFTFKDGQTPSILQ